MSELSQSTARRLIAAISKSDPNFAVLRATRDAVQETWIDELCRSLGWSRKNVKVRLSVNPTCYCDCTHRGPCEHSWDGPGEEFDSGRGWSATCSRCGMSAFSHDMRFLP